MAIGLNHFDAYQKFTGFPSNTDNISLSEKNPYADKFTIATNYSKSQGDTVSISNKKPNKSINKYNSKDFEALKVLSPARKALDCYEEYKDGNCIYGVGIGLRLINDLGKDTNRIRDVFISSKTVDPQYQKPFYFIQGTLIEKSELGNFLSRKDKNLFDLKTTKQFLKKFGMKKYVRKDGHIKIEGSAVSKILGGTALRIPVLGIGLYIIIGTDGLIKAKTNKERAKELAKDVINAVTIWTTAGLLGCIGKRYGKAVDLLAMGAGFVIGRILANKINKIIFEKEQINTLKLDQLC